MVAVFEYLNESSSFRLSSFQFTFLIFHMDPIRLLLSRWNWNFCWKVNRTLTYRRIFIRMFCVGLQFNLRRRVWNHIYILIVHMSETGCGHKSIIVKLFIILCQPFNYRWWQFLIIILFLCFSKCFLKACILNLRWGNSKNFLLI
jgi:hypothetical protein